MALKSCTIAAKPKVSILIPLYNSEKYIAETIDSCLDQTYENIEIIVVDDGSTDSGLIIAKQYANKHANIKIGTQKNSGASAARNRAFELSTGEYIQYLDADDLLHPDKIRLQMEVLKNEDERTLIFGRWGTFYENIEKVVWKNLLVNKKYDNPKQFLVDLWASGMTIVIYSWLMPRKLIEESGGWNEKLSTNDDGEFSARIVFTSNKILFIEESKGYYRKDNENSLSKQVSKKALVSNLKSFETYVKLMKDDMDKLEVRSSLALVYSRFLYKVPPSHKDLISETKNKINSLGFKKPLNTMKTHEYFLSYFLGTYNMFQLKKFIKTVIKYRKS